MSSEEMSSEEGSGEDPQTAVSKLESMGFLPAAAREALRASSGDLDAAAAWLVDHQGTDSVRSSSAANAAASSAANAASSSSALPASEDICWTEGMEAVAALQRGEPINAMRERLAMLKEFARSAGAPGKPLLAEISELLSRKAKSRPPSKMAQALEKALGHAFPDAGLRSASASSLASPAQPPAPPRAEPEPAPAGAPSPRRTSPRLAPGAAAGAAAAAREEASRANDVANDRTSPAPPRRTAAGASTAASSPRRSPRRGGPSSGAAASTSAAGGAAAAAAGGSSAGESSGTEDSTEMAAARYSEAERIGGMLQHLTSDVPEAYARKASTEAVRREKVAKAAARKKQKARAKNAGDEVAAREASAGKRGGAAELAREAKRHAAHVGGDLARGGPGDGRRRDADDSGSEGGGGSGSDSDGNARHTASDDDSVHDADAQQAAENSPVVRAARAEMAGRQRRKAQKDREVDAARDSYQNKQVVDVSLRPKCTKIGEPNRRNVLALCVDEGTDLSTLGSPRSIKRRFPFKKAAAGSSAEGVGGSAAIWIPLVGRDGEPVGLDKAGMLSKYDAWRRAHRHVDIEATRKWTAPACPCKPDQLGSCCPRRR